MRATIKSIIKISCIASLVLILGCNRGARQPDFEQTFTQVESYLLSGQVESALIESQNLLRINPDSAETYQLIGNAYATVGDYKNAAISFSKSLTLKANPEVLVNHIDALARLGQVDAAQESLEKLQKNQEFALEIARLQGDIALVKSDLSAAQKFYETAVELDPNHSHSLLGLARVFQNLNNRAKTTEWLNKAIASSADFTDAFIFQGYFLLSTKKPDQAEAAFSTALSSLGKYDVMTSRKYQAIEGLSKAFLDQGRSAEALQLKKTLADSPQGKIQTNIRNALEAYQEGDTTLAQENFERVLQLEPNHQLSNLGLGMIKLKDGDIETAEHLLSQASRDLAGINENAFKALTIARLQLGNRETANEILESGLERFPDSQALQFLKASILADSNNLAPALAILDKLLERNSLNSDALNLKAKILLSSGETVQAQALFKSTIQSRPEFFPAYSGLFASYSDQPEQALKEVEAILNAQKPPVLATELALGVGYALAGNPAQSAQIARKILQKAPQNQMSKNLLSSSLHDLAIQDFKNEKLQAAYIKTKEAIGIAPQPKVVTLYTRLAVDLQRPDEAVSTLQGIIKNNPDFNLAHELLGDLMTANGNHDQAVTYFENTWNLEPSFRLGIKLFRVKFKKQTDLDLAKAHLETWRDITKANFESATDANKQPRAVMYEASLFALSTVYEQNNLELEAIEIYSELLKLNPESALYLNNIAWLKFEHNQEGAIDFAKKAFELAPETGEIIDTYAWILVQTGQTEKGLELLKLASEKSPNNKAIQQHLQQATAMQSKSI